MTLEKGETMEHKIEVIKKRVSEIAKEHCEDYPNIEERDTLEKLWAISTTLQGITLANEDCHKVIKTLQKKLGLKTKELLSIFENVQNQKDYKRNFAYRIYNKPYRKLKRHEIIKKEAMQSWENGELHPIKNCDGQTVGSTPNDFSDERDFYCPV